MAVFRATPGSLYEILQPPRNLPVELLAENAHGSSDRLRFLTEEARGIDVALELFHRNGQIVLRCAVLPKERGCDLVHIHVRRLGREHYRDEELEVRAEAECNLCVGVLHRQPLDDRADPLATSSEAPTAGLANVATRHGSSRTRRSPCPNRAGRAGAPGASRRRVHQAREWTATVASTSYSVCRNSTSGPRSAQNAPRLPSYGMPTLPGFTRRSPLASFRSYCMCVCPQTSTSASTRPRRAATSSSGVIRV